MPAFTVTASTRIEASVATVGHGYSWSGNKVGAGAMEWMQIAPNQLNAKLTFLKPFKSVANTHFNIDAIGSSTEVEWVMNSSLPFFMFFMVGQFKAMIKMDYKRGLAMLKDYIETGAVDSRMSAEGAVDTPASPYIGVTATTTMDDIAASMEKSFGELSTGLNASGINPVGPPMALYHKMDIKQAQCHYTAALPVADGGATLQAAGLALGETVADKAFKVVHTGPYRHIGNAWALAMSDMRHAKLKANKRQPPFERYLNDPSDTAEQDLITEIYVPLR